MHYNIKTTVAVTALISVFAAAIILAEATGIITGQIIDSQTKQPVIGATVLLVGSDLGAITDRDGKFVIKRVPPGKYSVRITSIGYQTVELIDVEVKADLTVDIKGSLTQTTEVLDEKIEIESRIDVIDKFQTSSQNIITKEAAKGKPVQTVDELIEETAGVTTNSAGEVIIRGGRGFKVSYIVDGVPVNNPLVGSGQTGVNFQRIRPESPGCFPPAHGGTAIVNGEPFDAMFFENYGVNPFVDTEDDHLSTFAVDVDDASFVLTRSYLERATLPPKDAVRTEEFVNHFDYNYPAPVEETFHVFLEGAPSQFGQNCNLLRIGIKGKRISERYRKPANLVFVVDVSGSMAREDRLELVKKALRMLVTQLRRDDNIGIVIYGTRGRVLLRPTALHHRGRILAAIDNLVPGGSTNCEEGLRLAYDMASRNFQGNKINRIILCSDGVANNGVTKAEDLLKQIKRHADRGITLSTVGFGMGNYNDVLMEKLGNKGNGYYAYVDDIAEARRVFVDNLTGALQVIARDVKIQIDFDPNIVRSYRLLGYENRNVADHKFRDDTEDGGEIGSGHSVTTLYEIKLKEGVRRNDIGRIFVRYKNPESGIVEEINRAIPSSIFRHRFVSCTPEYKLAAAAAEFAEIMRESYWARDSNLGDVLALANDVYSQTGHEDVLELMNLITKARNLRQEHSVRD